MKKAKKKRTLHSLVTMQAALMLMMVILSVVAFILLKNAVLTRSGELSDSYAQDAKMRNCIEVMESNAEKAIVSANAQARADVNAAALTLTETLHASSAVFLHNGDGRFYYRTLLGMTDLFVEGVNAALSGVSAYEGYHDARTGTRVLGVFLRRQYGEYSAAFWAESSRRFQNHISFANRAVKLYIALSVAFYMLLIILYIRNSRRMVSDISRVSAGALRLSDGEWSIPKLDESGFVEINHTIDALNSMKINIVQAMEEQKRKAELETRYANEQVVSMKKDRAIERAQLKALQMQINPHFLFNTLNAISRSALIGKPDITIDLVESISGILRYSLGTGAETATLEEELKALDAYIHIQTIRYQGRIAFETHIEPGLSLDKQRVPPLILQPFVENAIKHGLADVTQDGKVCIDISRQENDVVIRISDDGKGMNEAEMEAMRTSKPLHSASGIGVHNVLRRMEYHLGTKDAISFYSERGKGTVVTLRLPIERIHHEDWNR